MDYSRVLTLNASMEPLCVVGLDRAVVLLVSDRARLVEQHENKVLRSPSVSVPWPAVIALNAYVRVPYAHRAPLTRRTLLARDDYRCGYCLGHANTIDHVVPRAQKGRHEWLNVVAACRPCNARKRDRTPQQAGMELHHTPFIPSGPMALMVAVGRVEEEWEEYLLPA